MNIKANKARYVPRVNNSIHYSFFDPIVFHAITDIEKNQWLSVKNSMQPFNPTNIFRFLHPTPQIIQGYSKSLQHYSIDFTKKSCKLFESPCSVSSFGPTRICTNTPWFSDLAITLCLNTIRIFWSWWMYLSFGQAGEAVRGSPV